MCLWQYVTPTNTNILIKCLVYLRLKMFPKILEIGVNTKIGILADEIHFRATVPQ